MSLYIAMIAKLIELYDMKIIVFERLNDNFINSDTNVYIRGCIWCHLRSRILKYVSNIIITIQLNFLIRFLENFP